MNWLKICWLIILFLVSTQRTHALTTADVDMGTIYGVAGAPGSYSFSWFFVLQGGTEGYVTSIDVNAPPEISVDTSNCPLNVSLRTCQYQMKWCANAPGTYRTVVTATWYKIAPDRPDFREDGIMRQSIALDIQVFGSSSSQCAGSGTDPGSGGGGGGSQPTEPELDLALGEISILNAKEEADGNLSIAPEKDYLVQVPLSGTGFNNPEIRNAIVALQMGSQTLQKTVPLSSISGGGTLLQFPVKLLDEDVGDQTLTVTVDPLNDLGEKNRQNNTADQLVHVLCNVSEDGSVPWFYQSQTPWGSKDYANQAPKKMKDLGCLVTSLAMLFRHYGLDTAADGTSMDPGSVNRGLNMTPLFAELGPKYASYNGYTPSGAVQANGAVAFARNSHFMKCLRSSADVDGCLNQSKSAISFKGTSNLFGAGEWKLVNKELCKKNPVILKVPSISEPNNPAKAHFVLATGMAVDAKGEAQYIVNNPASFDGRNEKLPISKVKGYRLYRPTYDPSMVFFHLSGGADMVIIDPQGKRSGYNPLTQEFFNEIHGGTYVTAESISSPTDPNISTPSEVRFEGLEPISGTYRVQIFAKDDTPYQLTRYSFDTTGTINGISDKKGFLSSGKSVIVSAEHFEKALPVRNASLNIKKAVYFDTRYKDMAYISGVLTPSDGHSISTIKKYIQIKIGSFSKNIDVRHIKKLKSRGQTIYFYGGFGKHKLFIKLNADTGSFDLFVGNIHLEKEEANITTDVLIQADDVIGKGLVNFKDIKGKKRHGR